MRGIAAALSFGLILPLVLSCSSAHAAASCANPVGIWTNQLKSTLTITVVDAQVGQISGSYQSSSKFPLIDWLTKARGQQRLCRGDFICRELGSYHTVTSWSGICRTTSSTDTLVALWHLADSVAGYEWSHVLSGQDTFSPN